MLLGQLLERYAIEIARDDESCGRWVDQARMPLRDGISIERSDSRLDSCQRPAVRRFPGKERLGEHALGTASWIGPCLQKVVHALVAQPLNFLARERRLE